MVKIDKKNEYLMYKELVSSEYHVIIIGIFFALKRMRAKECVPKNNTYSSSLKVSTSECGNASSKFKIKAINQMWR